jgi:hypothetical protein
LRETELLIFCLSLVSCYESSHQTPSKQLVLPDSLASHSVLAAFRIGQDLNLLYANTNDTIHYRYFDKGLVLADTLIRMDKASFFSPRFKTTYVLEEDVVKCIHEQKIIHPSSNWQGQSPWKENELFEYERTDKK